MLGRGGSRGSSTLAAGLVLFLATTGCEGRRNPPRADAGRPDAGDPLDGGTAEDAGADLDGGMAEDAGGVPDAGGHACSPLPFPLVWSDELIDDNATTPDLDINPGVLTLATDPVGRPHVAYSGLARGTTPIHFAIRDEDGWSALDPPDPATPEGGDCCHAGKLAIDPNGGMHFAFKSTVDPDSYHEHYMWLERDAWVEAPEPDTGGFANSDLYMAVGAGGIPAFLILGLDDQGTTGLQRAASYAGGNWSYFEIDDEPAQGGGIGVDREGAIYAVYEGARGDDDLRPLLLATDAGGAWSSGTLADPSYSSGVDLAVTTTGTIHACDYDAENQGIRCLECVDGACDTRILEGSVISGWSLIVDPWDRAHLAFTERDDVPGLGHIRHAELVDGAWQVEPIEDRPYVGRMSAAVGRDGVAHVVYWSTSEGGVMEVRHAWGVTCEPSE